VEPKTSSNTTVMMRECEDKYGKISHISLDVNIGEAWIKFEQIAGGQKAMKGLNGRFLDGWQDLVSHLTATIWWLIWISMAWMEWYIYPSLVDMSLLSNLKSQS
jgi:hypothetical protein